jgi:hypothetical protein
MVTVNVFVRSRVLVDAYCPIWMSLIQVIFMVGSEIFQNGLNTPMMFGDLLLAGFCRVHRSH